MDSASCSDADGSHGGWAGDDELAGWMGDSTDSGRRWGVEFWVGAAAHGGWRGKLDGSDAAVGLSVCRREGLDAIVSSVGHVDGTVPINSNGPWSIELAWLRAGKG
jgi:hypothetical protein